MFTQVTGMQNTEKDMEALVKEAENIRSLSRKAAGMESVNKEIRFETAKIMGTDNTAPEITDREWKRSGRVQRLRRERRQKCLTISLALAVIICMILICVISYSSIKVQANTGFKYYTGITVESGETLWSIADRYIDYDYYEDKASYIAEVENINHLNADDPLLTGQFLVVPYYSTEYIR